MHEIVINLHMHTRFSDGSGSHHDIAAAALKAGLDAVIVTDHNVLVRNMGGYIGRDGRRLLMLIGEEVHDRDCDPQKNHLLVLGARTEMAQLAADAASLIKAVRDAGGLSFIAHMTDPAAPVFHEPDISWVDWSVEGFTGLELWNGFSELKTLIPTKLHGLFYAFAPALVAHTPPPETVRKWDELLQESRVVAIGGSDAHALHMRMGPLRRTVYPYEFHFGAINTHVLLPEPLSGREAPDEQRIYSALSAGHCFVAHDRLFPARGFRFTARGREGEAIMGDELDGAGGVTLQAYLPSFAEICLIRNGEVVQEFRRGHALTHHASRPGAYRVEAHRRYFGRRRGWIFSNPIYVR
jgi:hypothetical protein